MNRVLLLTTNLARGGAESQVAQLAAGLRSRGWDVAVTSLLPPTAFADELEAAGVPVRTLGMRPGLPDPRALWRLIPLLRRFRPGVVHAHMFHANLLARLARLLYPVPAAVCTSHSVAETARGSGDSRLRELAYRATDWLSDATVAVCRAGADRLLASRAAPARKLRVVPNGIDTARYRPDPERRARVRRALGMGEEFAWLAAGRLMWKKDYPTMIRAFAAAGRGVLLIAGAGPDADTLRAEAAGSGAGVRFLGQREDIPDLMCACDALLLSSVIEGLPMVLLEAAASGLPCIATRVGGAEEVVVHGQTGLVVEPGDAAAFADAMRRLADMPPEVRREMGARGRAHIEERYSLSRVLDLWEDLYRELLAGARMRAMET